MTTTHPQESRTDRVAPSATTPSSTGSIDVASLPSPGIEQQVHGGVAEAISLVLNAGLTISQGSIQEGR